MPSSFSMTLALDEKFNDYHHFATQESFLDHLGQTQNEAAFLDYTHPTNLKDGKLEVCYLRKRCIYTNSWSIPENDPWKCLNSLEPSNVRSLYDCFGNPLNKETCVPPIFLKVCELVLVELKQEKQIEKQIEAKKLETHIL